MGSVNETIVYLVIVGVLCYSQLCQGSFESQCVVEGSQVEFYCYSETEWSINEIPLGQGIPEIISFTTNNETGSNDFMTINATSAYVDLYCNVSIVKCLDNYNEHLFAMLVIMEELETAMLPMLVPLNWTSLYLQWYPPECIGCYSHEYVDYNFNLSLSTENGDIAVWTIPHTGNDSVDIELVLEGYECMMFTLEISLPGNCKPASITGALFISPEYPLPSGLHTAFLNYTSLVIMWNHPEPLQHGGLREVEYSYTIVGEDSSGAVIMTYNTSIASTATPYEVLDMTGKQCAEITFFVSLLRDCRAINTTAAVPHYPVEFTSTEIIVEGQYSANLELNKIEVHFNSPADLCDFQKVNYSMVFLESSSGRSWEAVSDRPIRGGESIREDVTELQWFNLESCYTVIITLFTELGNVSSCTNFGLGTPFGGVVSQLKVKSLGHDKAILSWSREWRCKFESYLTVTYQISASLVESGETVGQWSLPLAGNQIPSLSLTLETYACEAINYTVTLFGKPTILATIIHILHSYPKLFQQEVSAEATFNKDGSFKQIEIEFKPPRLCSFQKSSYVLSYSGGGETWSNEPVDIVDTGLVVKEDLAFHISPNTEYNISINVTIGSDSIISYTTVKYTDLPSGDLSAHSNSVNSVVFSTIGAVLGIILISATGAVWTIVCIILIRKRRERKKFGFTTRARANAMVPNPIYDGNDGHYEQLPDCRGHPPPSLPLPSAPPPSQSYPIHQFTPTPLPPPRNENSALYSSLPTMGKLAMREGFPESKSLSRMSNYSSEDCYTVMNSAGTVTILPRISTTSPPPPIIPNEKETQMMTMTSNDGKSVDDDDVSV